MSQVTTEAVLQQVVAALKEERIRQGLSHQQLADKAGVTRPAISFMESGKRRPSLLMCLNISKALKVDLGEIISASQCEPPS